MSATFVACLTPPGRGAIATVAVRGPKAWEAVRPLLRPIRPSAKLPRDPAVGQVFLARFGGDAADEAVLSVTQAAPEIRLEVHTHGGDQVVRMVLEALKACGVVEADWRVFDKRAVHADACTELVKACTIRTASILLDQAKGAFKSVLARIHAAIGANDTARAAATITELARYAPVGRHLSEPWRVAVLGPPNVGKSSLVNALAGFQRSIVSPLPGTTRDVVTTLIAIDGWPVELADTAGQRPQACDLEAQGIARARTAGANADLVLWVMDASCEPTEPPPEMPSVHIVVNKIDLPAAWDVSQSTCACLVSAKTGAGLEILCRQIVEWIVPDPPPAGAAVPYTAELCDRIEAAQRLCALGDWSGLSEELQSP